MWPHRTAESLRHQLGADTPAPPRPLTALIVIFFDVTLALACFFGAGAVMQRSRWLQMGILLFGSLIIICIGVSLLRAAPGEIGGQAAALSVCKTISSACVVTWFNPRP